MRYRGRIMQSKSHVITGVEPGSIAEEMGLIATMMLIVCYVLFFWRGIKAALACRSEKEAQAILAPVKEAADKMGLTAETIHATNPFPAAAIVETAKEQDCNLIVMASHGRRGIRRALLGSQAAEVVSTSNIPVLVIR